MMMSGKGFMKSHVLSWRRKVYSDWKDVTSSGILYTTRVCSAIATTTRSILLHAYFTYGVYVFRMRWTTVTREIRPLL